MPSASSPPPPRRRTLRDALRSKGPMPPDHAAHLLEELAVALRDLHAGGVVHGALEPGRVILDVPTGRARLRAGGDEAPASPAYLAPEQLDSRPPTIETDVYALGLVGWEMLAGRAPWAGESLYTTVLKQREQELPSLTTLRPEVPAAIVAVIEGALHKDPSRRWRSADEFLAHLRRARAALVPPTASPPPRSRWWRRKSVSRAAKAKPSRRRSHAPGATRRRRRGIAALVLAFAAAVAGGVLWMQERVESQRTAAWLDAMITREAAGEVALDSSADSLAQPSRGASSSAPSKHRQRGVNASFP